eukprot:scaffold147872_cov41-Prasinocladus_malaysianus.AAC.1
MSSPMTDPSLGIMSADKDVEYLQRSVRKYCAPLDRSILAALYLHMFVGFQGQFVSMSDQDIDSLDLPPDRPGNPRQPLPRAASAQIKILRSFYNHESRKIGKPYDILLYKTKADYDVFRTMIYDPDDPPPPFFVKTKADLAKSKEELEWQKIIKPSKSDYKELKDEATWATYKEGFVTQYKAHNLEHLFDESYIPANEAVFTSQQRWMYEIMRDKFRAPPARKIVYRYANDSNIAQLWKELCKELDNSLTQDFRASKLITYLTSADLSDKTVKGGSEAQILFYKNCVRTLHENTPTEEHFTEKQLLKFLEKAASK